MMLATMALLVAAAGAPVLHKYDALVLNADASRIATVEATRAEDAPADGHASVVVRDAAGAIVATFDPCAACRYGGPAWSPDGTRLAFVSDDTDATGQATLYVVDRGTARPLAVVKGNASTPRWSPDGRLVAMLVTLDARKKAGATEPGVRRVGEIDDTHDSRRIAVFDAVAPTTTAAPATATPSATAAAGGPASMRLVSPDHTFVYEYDWLPDGSGFVGTAAEGNGDNNWWIARLVRFDLDGRTRVLATPSEQINLPRVSPDGRQIAFIGGRMSDFGSIGGDLFVVAADGGKPVDITPDTKESFTAIRWQGDALVATTVSGGGMGVVTIDPATRKRSATTAFAGSVSSGVGAIGESGSGLAADATGGIVAYASETFESPPHIEYGAAGRTHAITHDNDALAARTVARSVAWRNEGFDVQGWLLAPLKEPKADERSDDRSAMVTIVHGGPSAVFTPRFVWDRTVSDLLAHGYYVFLPNPRGSYGQGLAFANANYRAFGRGDFRDILAGIDAVERIAPIDDQRLGIAGHSYGGFMTMWAVTHTSRFKAAVAGAGVANWVSYYGTNGIDQWMTPFFGKTLYDDPQIYDDLSPIRTIKAATTPTLIYVGERDVEVPASQSEEFWHGLRAFGVPTAFVIYEGEGHRIRTPAHIADLNARTLDWFERYLGNGPRPSASASSTAPAR